MRRTWRVGVVSALLALAIVIPATGAMAQGSSRPVFDPRSLPSTAGASYVCEVEPVPPGSDPQGGRFGSLIITFYAEANCAGNIVGYAWFFSEGATSPEADSRFLVSETMLQTYFLMLQRAAGTGQKVFWKACSQDKRRCLVGIGARGADTAVTVR